MVLRGGCGEAGEGLGFHGGEMANKKGRLGEGGEVVVVGSGYDDNPEAEGRREAKEIVFLVISSPDL